MATEKVEFSNSAGEILSGVLELPSQPVRGWAIFAHCFTCSKSILVAGRIARGLAALGIGTLRFDFTGLGASEGDFAATGFTSNVEDLHSAMAWMAASGRTVSLLIGHSLGGAASIVAAHQAPAIRAVATIGAPSDAEHVIHQFSQNVTEIETAGEAVVDLQGRPFRIRKSFLDDVRGARVKDAARDLKRPLLIMHSPLDDTVDIDNATALFLAAKHPKSFVSLDRAEHLVKTAAEADYIVNVISGWSQAYFDAAPVPQVQTETDAESGRILISETGQNGPYQNRVEIDGRSYFADEPESFGGAGTGPDPYAWVTAGLGACTSITLRMYANRKQWPLEQVKISLAHEKRHIDDCVDCGPQDKIDVFERHIELIGRLDEDQRARLLEIADRCPVHRTLERGARVETHFV